MIEFEKYLIIFLLYFNFYFTVLNADFDICEKVPLDSNLTIADTLNGNIKGLCQTVPVSYSNSSTISADVFSWRSIPYAEPPINTYRFRRSIPVNKWSGVKEATKYPNSCFQMDDITRKTIGSEDCLYLNVFVRSDIYLNRKKALSPILVFIHGGDFVGGSSSDYDQSTIVAMSGIVAVTIQYRLDAFGFLRLEGTDATGNQGLLDQHLALKWIFDNARYFGGDQKKITINGESTGADSVFFCFFQSYTAELC